jgi:hypothetical protein
LHKCWSAARKNTLGKVANKNDRNGARALAELLYRGTLKPVYHGGHGVRTLKELPQLSGHHAGSDAGDESTEAIYRSWVIPCAVQQVYAPRYRTEWPAKIAESGMCRRAEFYYQQLDALAALRQQADLKERVHFDTEHLKQQAA